MADAVPVVTAFVPSATEPTTFAVELVPSAILLLAIALANVPSPNAAVADVLLGLLAVEL